MKNFKKVAIVLMVLVLATALVLSAVACAKTVGDKGTVSVVLAPATEGGEATEYVVDLSKLKGNDGLMAVLAYLKDKEGLTYTETASEYGAFLTQVGDLKQDTAKGEYIYLYTSVAKDADTGAYATTVTYKEHTLTSSGVGSSSMTIEDGAIIYIGIVKW